MHIGFGNVVPWPRVVVILTAKGNAKKRLREEAQRDQRLIDACSGRECRALVITDSKHVVLSAVAVETLNSRLAQARQEAAEVPGYA